MKRAITEQQLAAAVAAGAVVNAEALAAVASAALSNDPVIEAAAPAAAPVIEVAAPAAEVPAVDAPAAAAPAADAGVVDYLKAEIKTKDNDLVAARVQIAGLQSQIEAATGALTKAEADVASMKGIVCKSINVLQVAMGGTALDMASHSAEQVLAEHTRLSGEFGKKFKAGGVAAVDAAAPQARPANTQTGMQQARLSAVRATK